MQCITGKLARDGCGPKEKKVPAPNNFPNAFQYDGPFIGGSMGVVPAMWPPLGRGGWATGTDLAYSGHSLHPLSVMLASTMSTPITVLRIPSHPNAPPSFPREWLFSRHSFHGARLLLEGHNDRTAFRASSSTSSLRSSRLLSRRTSCINFVPAAGYHILSPE
ncbi:hypothetical protein LX36DRAFT_343253 [Colletotrichum falcatum]|nr:hypothetical protein LX36DRAFT_343253 [Colletotrichum falcatum]